MSWDIVLFNSRQKIDSAANIDENMLEPTDFSSALEGYFKQIVKDDNAWTIKGEGFTIVYYHAEEDRSNTMLNLYGESGFYELVVLARKCGWQIFDTGLGEMVDLENPSNNGYENFQSYLQHVLKNPG
jgi:hypothetical protein